MEQNSPEERERAAFIHLKRSDAALHARALPHRGTISTRIKPKRTNNALFQSLVSSIVSQQLSTKAAQSIYARLVEVVGGNLTPTSVLAVHSVKLRTAGLSEAKVRSITELAQAIESKELNLLRLKKLPAEEAVKELTKVFGIGVWTAEMFLIFALGAPDVFSPGDLILDRQMRKHLGISPDVSRKELTRMAERWSPHRSFVSLLFWKLHHVQLDAEAEAKTKGTK
ncbi:MAG: HhH-GPD family protein [Parcubacteria group bacterium]|nr:HhH-GPD family protein [Parcubacteria group bacterium]